jgi:hypothetical protein
MFQISSKISWQSGELARRQDGKTAKQQFLFSRLAVLPFSHLAQLLSAEV